MLIRLLVVKVNWFFILILDAGQFVIELVQNAVVQCSRNETAP